VLTKHHITKSLTEAILLTISNLSNAKCWASTKDIKSCGTRVAPKQTEPKMGTIRLENANEVKLIIFFQNRRADQNSSTKWLRC